MVDGRSNSLYIGQRGIIWADHSTSQLDLFAPTSAFSVQRDTRYLFRLSAPIHHQGSSRSSEVGRNMAEFDYKNTVIDLHDISLLLTYERGTTEPRFRHAKLRELVLGPANFRTVRFLVPDWDNATIPRTGYVFDKPTSLSKAEEDEPDLPSNMIKTPTPAGLENISAKDLEIYYWQPRNHDGCYRTVVLFQHLFDLFPSDLTRVRVRVVENNKPRIYTTLASDRLIVEMKLQKPKTMNLCAVLPVNQTYTTGADDVMDHAVLAFPPPSEHDQAQTILDLSSLQFGEAGRGFKGRGLFILESVHEYKQRLSTFAEGNNFDESKVTRRINPIPKGQYGSDDEYLKDVARRVKARWEGRQTDPWCGHCGSPARSGPLLRCSKCQGAFYCDRQHQLAAWPYHKHFCTDPSSKKTCLDVKISPCRTTEC